MESGRFCQPENADLMTTTGMCFGWPTCLGVDYCVFSSLYAWAKIGRKLVRQLLDHIARPFVGNKFRFFPDLGQHMPSLFRVAMNGGITLISELVLS